jgi:hypothetical protein
MLLTVLAVALLAAPAWAFPTVETVLDDFNRSGGPTWTTLFGGSGLGVTNNNAHINSAGAGDGAGYLNTAGYGPDHEFQSEWVYDGGSGSYAGIGGLTTGDVSNGYWVFITTDSRDELTYYRMDGDSFTQLTDKEGYTETINDILAIDRDGNNLNAWVKRGGSWTQYSSRSDSTYNSGSFYPALDLHVSADPFPGAGQAFDNLKGGTKVAAGGGCVPRMMLLGLGC